MVLASAVVDPIRPATPISPGLYKVEVWGQEPYDYVRIYQIQAGSDNLAAREGIDKFVQEMEALDGRSES
jgi:hypothetical protein